MEICIFANTILIINALYNLGQSRKIFLDFQFFTMILTFWLSHRAPGTIKKFFFAIGVLSPIRSGLCPESPKISSVATDLIFKFNKCHDSPSFEN